MNKLIKSASGGAVTALAESIIAQGGVVFGVRYSSDFHTAEYCCINTVEMLEQIKGSKYTVTQKKNTYQILSKYLEEGKLVLYTGLGCDIAAVKSYCKVKGLNTKNLFTVDILCHGPAPKEVHEKFVLELEEKYGGKLQDFTIRYKKDGWTPFYIRAVFNNGKKHIEPFNESDYGRAFYNVARPVCTKCKFKGTGHLGDLCVGDYWGMTADIPGWNQNGVSIIVVQTANGERLLKMLSNDFEIREADEDLFLRGNPMYSFSRKQNSDYQSFMNELRLCSLHYAVSKLPKHYLPIKHRIKKIIINLIKKFKDN